MGSLSHNTSTQIYQDRERFSTGKGRSKERARIDIPSHATGIGSSPVEENMAPPSLLPVRAEGIPADLKARRCWVIWEARFEEDFPERMLTAAGKWSEAFTNSNTAIIGRWHYTPFDPAGMEAHHERSHPERSHSERGHRRPLHIGVDFETALAESRSRKNAGVGIMLSEESGIVAVQMEDTILANDLPQIDAARAIRALDTYAERSPDGKGITLLLRGHLPPGGCRRDTTSFFETDRLVPITGWKLTDAAPDVGARQAQLEEYHATLFPQPPKRTIMQSAPPDLSDEEVLQTAFRSSNATRIQQLYRGDASAIPGGRNAADLALCSMLGFFTGNDAARLDRLFRKSALFRPRWDTAVYSNATTYGEATIAKALDGCLLFHNYPVQVPPRRNMMPTAHMPSLRETGAAVYDNPPARQAPPAPPASQGGITRKDTKVALAPDTRSAPEEVVARPVASPTVASIPATPILKNVEIPAWCLANSGPINPTVFAEQVGRAEGLAQREMVLNAQEAAHLLKISPRLLRRSITPWRRFGGSPSGDRWLLSDLLAKS